MELISIKDSCLGKDITLKIGKMKKAESFCHYPIIKIDGKRILPLQSEHRWAQIDLETGEIELSARRNQYATSWFFIHCKVNGNIETDKATEEQLKQITEAVQPPKYVKG